MDLVLGVVSFTGIFPVQLSNGSVVFLFFHVLYLTVHVIIQFYLPNHLDHVHNLSCFFVILVRINVCYYDLYIIFTNESLTHTYINIYIEREMYDSIFIFSIM